MQLAHQMQLRMRKQRCITVNTMNAANTANAVNANAANAATTAAIAFIASTLKIQPKDNVDTSSVYPTSFVICLIRLKHIVWNER